MGPSRSSTKSSVALDAYRHTVLRNAVGSTPGNQSPAYASSAFTAPGTCDGRSSGSISGPTPCRPALTRPSGVPSPYANVSPRWMKLGHGPRVGWKNATVSAVTVMGGTNLAATSGSSSALDQPAVATTATRAVTTSPPTVTATPEPVCRTACTGASKRISAPAST